MSKPEKARQISCFILTVSDTRNETTDKSGNLIQELLEAAGHLVVKKVIVSDDIEAIQTIVKEVGADPIVEMILLNGGTGIAHRDVTIEAIQPLLHKQIPGFGEIFRTLSYYEDIGSSAIMSRAVAGVYHNQAIFAMPGSTGAVKLAMNKLILPEMSHIVHEIQKDLK